MTQIFPRTIFHVAAKFLWEEGRIAEYQKAIFRCQTLRAAKMWGPSHPITRRYHLLEADKIREISERENKKMLEKEFTHRNGESENPTVDGWYWCVWNKYDGTPDLDMPIPMEWFENRWFDDHSSENYTFIGILPDMIFGPIPYPAICREPIRLSLEYKNKNEIS